MEWLPATVKNENEYKIPERWLHIHYYEALNILFRFENSLRVFVYAILKNEYFDEWKSKTFTTNDNQQKSIQNLAAKRISQADNFGYLGYDVKCPIMHLTSGELIDLLTNDSYWQLFKSHFRGNKEIIKNKLQEIGNIRNSLAHFRPIKTDDVELIKQNARHTLVEIEKCLENLFNQNQKVPTNTPQDWYRNISTLGNSFIITNPLFSKDENWVNLQLIFNPSILEKASYSGSYFSYKIARLVTPNIVTHFPELAKLATYISENVRYPQIDRESNITVKKQINIVIGKQVLCDNWQKITDNIKGIIEKISQEMELLTQDNLARGELLETTSCTAYQNNDEKKRWNFNYDSIKRPYEPNDPDEYWGDFVSYQTDIVAGAKNYPWMPSEISKEEFPF